MSIYVTLPSNGGGKEFGPSNQNSEYKIRLPERLKLLDEEWEMALASVSLTHVRCRQAKHSPQVHGNDQSRVQNWSVGVRGERPTSRSDHQFHSIKSSVR